MSTESLLRLRSRLNEVPGVDAFAGLDVDRLLEARETAPFDEEWVAVSRRLEAVTVSDDDRELIDLLREHGYKRTYALTHSPDLSALVSDDIELIALGLIAGVEDGWLNSILDSYLAGEFPRGEVHPRPGALLDRP